MTLLDSVKDYLRVDSDIEDDMQISALIKAATQYISKQTGKQYVENDEVWNTAIKLLVAHWYDNRAMNSSKAGQLYEFSHSVTAIINHISLCSDYPEVSSGEI